MTVSDPGAGQQQGRECGEFGHTRDRLCRRCGHRSDPAPSSAPPARHDVHQWAGEDPDRCIVCDVDWSDADLTCVSAGQQQGRERELAVALESIGRWVDTAKPGESRSSLEWRRVTKVCSEAGEAQDALDIATGGNPRKAGTKTYADVEKELLDAAGAALGAVEFLRGYDGSALGLLVDHMTSVAARAAAHRTPAPSSEENARG